MKRSGYRTIFHIYLIFFLSLLAVVLLAGYLLFLTITVQKPDGGIARSDWPKQFTEQFKEQLVFVDAAPRITQAGLAELRGNGIGVQILNAFGHEVFSYRKPERTGAAVSGMELWKLCQTGRTARDETTVFMGTVSHAGDAYTYLLYFPVNISKVTMYLNGDRFAGGKSILLPILSALFWIVLLSGVVYGIFTARAMNRLTAAVQEISVRGYLPVQSHGVFHDLYESLNTLNAEIRASDQLRARTEKIREEWIANITHDLKTPLSPIRGYAELLEESGGESEEQCRRYAAIMLKNVSCIEALIDDLKLTYQLENGMLPVNREERSLIRFLKELAIDILNIPEYEDRVIRFESTADVVAFSFDAALFARAFRNLIINAFVHGEEDTEVSLRVSAFGTAVKIEVADNGNGMRPELLEHLFDRYYRGTGTEQKPEGSGLGLAIAKGIIELHGGVISVASVPTVGTTFFIEFLIV